ncbi:MAG TPA: hypothetical protein PKD64_11120 [Pirellulaceae bacterium]|nr:hypothetical protein [Pirellulaceae bacterium]HMO92734.1 hypothetical protein [Pirellulaceae bacterium]HMP70286.1 hypothetical protein [Pirellulaceae bacterium]
MNEKTSLQRSCSKKAKKQHSSPGPSLELSGFKASIITSAVRKPTETISLVNDRIESRSRIRQSIPSAPGVYGWLDESRQVVYVGKSKSLRHRLLQYFAKSPPDSKMERIRDQSTSLVWETTSHELLALIREQELIISLRPPMNVQGQPHRKLPGYICLRGGTAPRLVVAKAFPTDARTWFGPITGVGRIDAAVVSANHIFQLRDCPDKTKFRFNNQRQLFERSDHAKCLRYELTTCPAPCVGACSQRSYGDNVQKALSFLQGDLSAIDILHTDMWAAAQRQAFERAIVLRDHHVNLTWIARQLGRLRKAEQELNGVYPLPGIFANKPVWLWLQRGEVLGCYLRSSAVPQNVLKQIDLQNRNSTLSENRLNTFLKQLVISWFRKHPEETSRLIPLQECLAKAKAA